MFDNFNANPSFNDLWARAFQFALNKHMTLHRAEQFASDYAEHYDGCDRRFIETPATYEVRAVVGGIVYHHSIKD